MLEQGVVVVAVVGRDRQPDARRDEELLAPEQERLLERGPHLVGNDRFLCDVDALDAGQEDRELVTAEARHGVFLAEGRQKTLGHLLQQLVSDRVAQGVVHVLEPIEVEEEQGEAVAGAL